MSVQEETLDRPKTGAVTKLFAVFGGFTALVAVGVTALVATSDATKSCTVHGHPAVVCAAGALGFVDLAGLAARDEDLKAATARAATLEQEKARLAAQASEAEARIRDLEAAAKTAGAEAERLRGEMARRDARIADLDAKLAAAMKRPEAAPLPVTRPVPPTGATAPKPKP